MSLSRHWQCCEKDFYSLSYSRDTWVVHLLPVMSKPDSQIRLYTPFVLPLTAQMSCPHQLKDLMTSLVQAKIQTDCEISQTWHAREGGEAGDNATGSSLGQLCARIEVGRIGMPYFLHRRCQVPWNKWCATSVTSSVFKFAFSRGCLM